MFIEKLSIKNFGPFDNEEITFKHSCINFIQGDNSTGKTQLVGSLLFLLHGKSVIDLNTNVENKLSYVEAVIKDNKETFKLARVVEEDNFYLSYSSRKETSIALNKVDNLKSDYIDFNPFILFNEKIFYKQIKIELSSTHKIDELLLADDESLTIWNKIKDRIKSIGIDKKRILTYSYGEQFIITFISIILQYLQTSSRQPIIIDSIMAMLDYDSRRFILSILNQVSRQCQVILLDSIDPKKFNIFPLEVVKKLEYHHKQSSNKISYKYDFNHQNISFENISKEAQVAEITIQYVKDQIINIDENRFFEYKEARGHNPVNSILSIVDQYVVSFLNDIKVQRGYIIWGITDSEHKVVGVKLDSEQRDLLRREIPEKLNKILPVLPQSAYEINIVSVVDLNNNIINDWFIVEVVIHPVKSNLLYSTSSGEIYIKTDGGKKKMNMLEVQKELLFRNGIKINNI